MFLFQILNQLIIDILVSMILAFLKIIVNIEEKTNSGFNNSQKNIQSYYNYNHWERTILWLEDITESNLSYLPNQIHFISILVGIFYGVLIGVIVIFGNLFLGFQVSIGETILIILVFGSAMGLTNSKSLTNRPSIFDISNDEFKDGFFEK